MTYSIYIMRVSGCPQARGLRKIGVAKNVENRRQGIEKSLRDEFGKNVLVYVEWVFEISAKGKGGFKAYNLEHQLQTYLSPKNVRWINLPISARGGQSLKQLVEVTGRDQYHLDLRPSAQNLLRIFGLNRTIRQVDMNE